MNDLLIPIDISNCITISSFTTSNDESKNDFSYCVVYDTHINPISILVCWFIRTICDILPSSFTKIDKR